MRLANWPSSEGMVPVQGGGVPQSDCVLCMLGYTQARTLELVIREVQASELHQLPELRGNGACAREHSQFVGVVLHWRIRTQSPLTLELILLQLQVLEVDQLPELRGNGACHGISQFV